MLRFLIAMVGGTRDRLAPRAARVTVRARDARPRAYALTGDAWLARASSRLAPSDPPCLLYPQAPCPRPIAMPGPWWRCAGAEANPNDASAASQTRGWAIRFKGSSCRMHMPARRRRPSCCKCRYRLGAVPGRPLLAALGSRITPDEQGPAR